MNDHRIEPQADREAETDTEHHADLDRSIDSLVEIGRMWASHGLRIGRSALQTSARTLDVTADALSDIAERFEGKSRS